MFIVVTRTGIRRCVCNDFALLLRCHQRPAAGQRNATAVALRRFCGATQRTTQRRPGELSWTTHREFKFRCLGAALAHATARARCRGRRADRALRANFFNNLIKSASTRHTPTSRTLAHATRQQAALCRQTASPCCFVHLAFPSLRTYTRPIFNVRWDVRTGSQARTSR